MYQDADEKSYQHEQDIKEEFCNKWGQNLEFERLGRVNKPDSSIAIHGYRIQGQIFGPDDQGDYTIPLGKDWDGS